MAEKLLFAHSVAEALAWKDAHAAYLAGGTEINRLHSSVEAETLISLRFVEGLRALYREGEILWLGAALTFQQAVEAAEVPEWFREACRMMASRTKRNMATLGGNIRLLRDDSYILPALMADDALLVLAEGDGAERTVSLAEYRAARQSGLAADALIIQVGLRLDRRVFVKRYANTAMSHSVLNIALGTDAEGKRISIGIAAKNAGFFRPDALARAIEETAAEDEAAMGALTEKYDSVEFADDMFGSAAYKRYLLGTTLAKLYALSR